ncbi:MAG: DUF2203 domain-containing protein [Gemmatimonadetes bacterium]|nr:DUF2203 domain-containing protein [Gemmatimonadota bacterium]
MAVKYFTLEQANRTLPLVRRIVTDIVDEYGRWKEHVFRYELVAAGSSATKGESAEQVALREKVDDSAQRINNFVEELSRIGCVFKGFEEGLVDFHARMDDRDVLLCWKLGEEAIEYWHEMDTGFVGRQPIVRGLGVRGQGSGRRQQ